MNSGRNYKISDRDEDFPEEETKRSYFFTPTRVGALNWKSVFGVGLNRFSWFLG
jgi:hypothetical protein